MRSAVVLLLVPLCRASTNTTSRRLNASPTDRLRLEHPTLRKRSPSRASKGQISDEDKAELLSAPSPSSAAVPARVALPPRKDAEAGAASSIPSFMYGTAWKEARTAMLARLALDKVGGGGAARAFSPPRPPSSRLRARALSLARAAFSRHTPQGFAALDTATAERHYSERGVGDALRAPGAPGRDALFLQTKFTYARGHEKGREPWAPADGPEARVAKSLDRALSNLAQPAAGGCARRGGDASARSVSTGFAESERDHPTPLPPSGTSTRCCCTGRAARRARAARSPTRTARRGAGSRPSSRPGARARSACATSTRTCCGSSSTTRRRSRR